jgi:hypothetical protein
MLFLKVMIIAFTHKNDFYVAKLFFYFHVFLCDDAIDNMCDRHRPLNYSDLRIR